MKTLMADILVVGSGLAGTLFSLELAKKRPDLHILLLSKKEKSQSASFLAQGGIAATLPGSNDHMQQHLADTLEASAFTSNKAVAAHFISKAPEAIQTLEKWGTHFDQRPDGSRALALEGGHSAHRVLHHKDSTGKHIQEQLFSALSCFSNITLLEDVQVLDLLQNPFTKRVTGAVAWDSSAEKALSINARATILATGGLGSLYAYSTNPATAKGEGVYLAHKAGAVIKELAYVQFHPTALWQPSGSQLPLISEAVRGAGAVLRNEKGVRFMEGKHPRLDLAPRDILARCINSEIQKQEKPWVYLDASAISKEEWKNHFPAILALCRKAGVDPTKEWIPVVPASHYSCGGVASSETGETNIKSLYALGETACTGLHGANRLASNSLLEATIMATSLASHIACQELPSLEGSVAAEKPEIISSESALEAETSFLEEIRAIVQKGCGIEKSNQHLEEACNQLREVKTRLDSCLPANSISPLRLKMVLETALMLTTSCIQQTKNVGVFFNRDLLEETIKV